jgi:hypothetical protein
MPCIGRIQAHRAFTHQPPGTELPDVTFVCVTHVWHTLAGRSTLKAYTTISLSVRSRVLLQGFWSLRPRRLSGSKHMDKHDWPYQCNKNSSCKEQCFKSNGSRRHTQHYLSAGPTLAGRAKDEARSACYYMQPSCDATSDSRLYRSCVARVAHFSRPPTSNLSTNTGGSAARRLLARFVKIS